MTKSRKYFPKILLIIAAITYLICLSPNAEVYAETPYTWARVTKDSVNLYATETLEKVMFVLEKSYYVEIISEQDDSLFVSVMNNAADFPTVCGYVRKIEVELVDVPPIAPIYPTVKLTVTGDSAQLKLLPLPSAENVLAAVNSQQLSYYGKVNYYGTIWYYVYVGGKFGYVEKANVTPPQIELHPTPLIKDTPVIKPTDPNEQEKPTDNNNGFSPTAEILLIVFVVLLAAGLTLALFLPGNVKKNVFDDDI